LRKDNFKIVVAITSITQAGLSVLVPILLMGLLAKFLINKFGFTDKIMVFAIIFGVICGFYNMIKYIHSTINRNGDE